MYKIGILGDRDSVQGFMAVGLTVCPVQNPTEAGMWIERLAADGHAVIFITEQIAAEMQDVMDIYRNRESPAVIPIPGRLGSNGYGMRNVSLSVERAVGADIL